MRLAIILVLYSTFVGAALIQRDCIHDNCLRAVIASAFPTRNSAADCSSYFLATVTPATVTHTATSTVIVTTTTTTITGVPERRALPEPMIAVRQTTVVPSSIPAYASACSGSVRYSSACSCIGVTGETTTVAAPSRTVTSTTTVTTTSIFATHEPYTCPPQDAAGFHLDSEDTSSDPIFCSYPAFPGENPDDFFCTYSYTTGVLVTDHDAGFCPAQATTT